MENVIRADKHPVVIKFFLLPLYEINSKSIEPKFLNAYVNKEVSYLFLELNSDHDFSDNELYSGKCTIDNRDFHLFSTNMSMMIDIGRLLEGKYSQMSKLAKNKIVKKSGLQYMEIRSDGVYTSYPLMALFKFPEWKKVLEKHINQTIDDNSELLSALDKKRMFIEDISEVIKTS